ncbi:MAG: hypothetical protein AB7T31_03180 [Gemmatimonadales bacterium]
MAHATSAGRSTGRHARYRAEGEAGSETRQALARRRPSLTADLVYDAFFGGGIAGSAIALFMLVVDALEGQPLHTPAMMGAVLFDRVAASSVETVRLDMVSYFSIVHFATFAVLAVALSYVARRSRAIEGHLLVMAAIVFAVLTAVLLVADWVFMPGVVATIGYGQALAANALTGLALAAFMKWSHRPGRYGGDGPAED